MINTLSSKLLRLKCKPDYKRKQFLFEFVAIFMANISSKRAFQKNISRFKLLKSNQHFNI